MRSEGIKHIVNVREGERRDTSFEGGEGRSEDILLRVALLS